VNRQVLQAIIFAKKYQAMISITRANAAEYQTIADIGRISVTEAHRGSCPDEDLNSFIEKNYNGEAIGAELNDKNNIYHIICWDGEPAGFSKIILNAAHADIQQKNVTKLDRIYLLSNFFNRKLGLELLKFNIDLSKSHNQSGIWLYTWTGNERAINFYKKNGFVIIGSHDFQVTETRSNPNYHMLLRFS
jgi:ribosomal protein S18 acetylase RimI-like enzyme